MIRGYDARELGTFWPFHSENMRCFYRYIVSMVRFWTFARRKMPSALNFSKYMMSLMKVLLVLINVVLSL